MRCEPAGEMLLSCSRRRSHLPTRLCPTPRWAAPPSKTETVNPSGNASLVLAAGSQFGVVRVAGPFDSPMVGRLPAGRLVSRYRAA